MDIEKIGAFFKKYYGWLAFIFLMGLLYFGQIPIDIQQKLFSISLVLIAVPFALLAIYAITEIGKSVKIQYSKIRKGIEKEIKELREKQDKIKDIKKLIELDEEILALRQDIGGHQDSRFFIFILKSSIATGLTLALSMISLEKFVDVPTWLAMYITMNYAIYQFLRAFFDILTAMRR